MNNSRATAIALFSGGLDSILSCRIIQAQAVRVKALRFVTPFFGYELLGRSEEYRAEVMAKYGIDVQVVDVSAPYLRLLANPAHGYGKNFNPCLDCKIFLVSEAKQRLAEHNASFIITGEVLGQRPMSQRRDTLRVVERDSGCGSILVRPLCAKHLPPTKPEAEGLLDRDQLLDFSGRGRKSQIDLARSLGITDYPHPAGGCLLTDPILSSRIRLLFADGSIPTVADLLLAMVGRQFILPAGGRLALGRDEQENDRLARLAGPDDLVLKMETRPGPVAVLRGAAPASDRAAAAGLIVRYGKKPAAGENGAAPVAISSRAGTELILAAPLADEISRPWIV